MAEEIDFENGRFSNFEGLVTLTLTSDAAIRHTVVHHSSTSTYIPNIIQIEETFCGRTDGRTGRHFFPLILLGRLFEVDLKTSRCTISHMQSAHQSNLNLTDCTKIQPYSKACHTISSCLLFRHNDTFRSWCIIRNTLIVIL